MPKGAPSTKSPAKATEVGQEPEAAVEAEEVPVVLHVATLSRYEKDKVKRAVLPKPTSGKCDVPSDISEMWNSPQGRQKLFTMWCKSGGVKVD